jgi:alkylation response protein AidB-like acyl-CoA dehydrogenase
MNVIERKIDGSSGRKLSSVLPGSIPESMAERGLIFRTLPINEEFWRIDPGIAMSIQSCTFGSEMIVLFGSEEQKKKRLPPLVKGKAITGAAITEPDAGCDVSSVSTAGVLQGDEYVINGNKMFITNGTIANFSRFFVSEPPKRGMTGSVSLRTDGRGHEANKLKNKLGSASTRPRSLSAT